MIKLGSSDMAKAYLGSSEISKMYLGSELVYSKEVLPYDAKVSYLVSNSEAYIDTGISGNNNNLEITIKFLFTTFVAYGAIYGNYVAEGTNCNRLILDRSSGNGLVYINSVAGGNGNNSISIRPNILYNISVKRNSITINGTSYSPSNLASGTANNDNIALFNRSVTNPNTTRNIGLRIYSCQIRDNGVLVRDFIPVRVGQTGYLYDKITGTLKGNSGTGEFVLGSDVSVMPYDAEVEYLQSSGTQYINLPMDVKSDTFFELDMYFIPIYNNASKYSIFSANPFQQFESRFYSRNSTTYYIMYDSTIGTLSSSGAWGGTEGNYTHYILSTSGKTNNAGTYTALSRPLTANITAFRLFGGYRDSNRYPVKFHKMKITAGTTVLFDLKSVRVGQVGYMYDSISGELFGNNGTGNFILGNDIV